MLQHAKVCKAMGTPIVPAWKSASYWPLLCPDGSHLAQFVHECMLIPYFEALFLHGKSGNNIGDSLKSDSIVLCLWLDFSAPPRIGNYVFFCSKDFTSSCMDCKVARSGDVYDIP